MNEPLDQDALEHGSMMPEQPKAVRSSDMVRPLMDKEEIRSKRQYVCDVGHNAGQCIGNMCNIAMDDSRTPDEKRERMKQSLHVARREIAELEGIARQLMESVA